MAYCIESDISEAISKQKVRQLTDDTGGATVTSTALVHAITWADSKIDGYLRAQHSVPIIPVPALVKQMSIDLTVYRLYTRRLGDDMPETIVSQKKDVISQLKDIQKGLMQLSDTTSIVGTAGFYAGSKSSSDKVNTDTNMDNYFDPDDM